MYDSLMDHFLYRPSKPWEAHLKNDIESRMSHLSSKSTSVDVAEITEQLWKPTRTDLGIMITLAVCSLVYAFKACT